MVRFILCDNTFLCRKSYFSDGDDLVFTTVSDGLMSYLATCSIGDQADYYKLFAVRARKRGAQGADAPVSAYQNKAMAQLEGQIGPAKIGLARLSSPQLYYLLSGTILHWMSIIRWHLKSFA
jgi:hypothetical protein